jgi:DNA replication and repair protein RecF
MILKTLELKDFRNYEKEEIIFHKKINILTGKNAQGKTNLIEAINLLSLGKSFRTRKEQELIRFDTEEAFVKGIFEKKDRLHSTEIRLHTGASGKKEYFVNEIYTSTVSDLLGGIYTIVFSPEDLKIVKGDPETRRRFLDREIILLKPLYYHKLKKYRQALKTRNALLKNDHVSTELLDVYDRQLSEAASEIMKERKKWLDKMSAIAAETCFGITNGTENLGIVYKPQLSQISDEYSKEEIYDVLLRARERDVYLRSTENGPHKDDFSVYTNDLDLRIFGSQGQQRTAALSLRLAERELIKKETGEDAILLLDDVMSELDPLRQEKLLESFGDNQIFITAAGPFREEALRLGAAKVMKISEGKIT